MVKVFAMLPLAFQHPLVECIGVSSRVSYKETQWEAGRHKQELGQETIKGTRKGE